jgi:hypothetical protein
VSHHLATNVCIFWVCLVCMGTLRYSKRASFINDKYNAKSCATNNHVWDREMRSYFQR